MKVVILHGTDNDHTGNWFPWLKRELENLGHEVWVPDLPMAKKPNLERWTKFLLDSGWDFDDNLLIGHSAGAVEILNLLQNLPAGRRVNTAIMAAVFKGDLGWEVLKDLANIKYDYGKISKAAGQKIVVHSNDDPHCPISDARDIADKIGAEFIEMQGMKHFSLGTDPRFTKFPELLEIIQQKVV